MANFEARVIHNEMYPATYNFKDEADGTSGTDIDFVDSTVGTESVSISSIIDGHRKVLLFYDNDVGAYIAAINNFASPQATGTIECWSRPAQTNGIFYVLQTRDAANKVGVAVRFNSDGNIETVINGGSTAVRAYAANTWVHFRATFTVATETYDLWIDGILEANDAAFYDAAGAVCGNQTLFQPSTDTVTKGYFAMDAIGYYPWDASYKIGDNVYHRHYMESDSAFESEDWGTSGTTIACVDGGNDAAHCEIVPEFNEHKKILRFFDDDGSSDFYIGLTQATADILELWLKVTDATTHFKLYFCEDAVQCFYLKIQNDNLYDTDDGDIGDIVDTTWTPLRVQWYADNTYDVYLNGVFILDGDAMDNNQTSGINRLHIYGYGNDNSKYIYLDAISQISISGNEIGDNLTYDYHTYSYNDDTANVIDCIGRVFSYDYRDLYIGFTNSNYDKALHFFQIYDKDDILGFEGDIKIETQDGSYRGYYCLSKNKPEIEAQQNETFTTAKIYEMLQTLMPFTNSRLHLGNYDLDATTYSPTIINLPRIQCLQTLGYAGNKVIRIKANGIVEYHSGTATGLSITEASGEMSTAPVVKLLQDTFTKVTVYGGVNEATGVRFSGSAGSGEPEFWKTMTQLESDADCASIAGQILLGFATPKKIMIRFQGIGAYSAYDTLVFAYNVGDLTIASATWYILYERLDYRTAIGDFVLTNGVLESDEYNLPTHLPSEESSDDIAKAMFDTYLIDIPIPVYAAGGGATQTAWQVRLDAVDEYCACVFYIDEKMDITRDWILTCHWLRIDANNDNVNRLRYGQYQKCDGVGAIVNIWGAGGTSDQFGACAAVKRQKSEMTIAANSVVHNSWFTCIIYLKEAARSFDIQPFNLRYYQYKEVP